MGTSDEDCRNECQKPCVVGDQMDDSSKLPVSRGSSTGGTSSGGSASVSRKGGRSSPNLLLPNGVSRVPLMKLSGEKRARRCRFYRNGDRYFPGMIVAVGGDRHRSWEALLEDLTRILDHPLHLTAGVRFVFDLEGARLDGFEQLFEGGEFVTSSSETFKCIDYRGARLPQWRIQARRNEAITVLPRSSSGQRPSCLPSSLTPSSDSGGGEECPRAFIRPKIITILRNGIRPRKAVRVLLNGRTARSLEQVLDDITGAIKLDSGAVRKVFTLDGQQVQSLRDFFGEDDLFIAYGHERTAHDDFDLDIEEYRNLQPLLKSSISTRRPRRLPSPRPRARATSPLAIFDGPGSLPRSPRKKRHQSPHKRHSPMHGDVSCISGGDMENFLFPHCITSKYRVGRILGDGNFAIVRECTSRSTLKHYALKIIYKVKCKGKESMIDSEVSIMRKVDHPNIVKLIEEIDTFEHLFLVLELVSGGDLFDAIASAVKYTEVDASCMIKDLASALDYLHCHNIVHRDIKPENLMICERSSGHKSLKLGDFGLAVEVAEPLYVVCGTPTYVAPEILSESGYGLEVDIWATGVISYILLCGFPPFVSATNNQEELFDQILSGHYEFHSPYWDNVSDSAKEFIINLIQVEPENRFTAAQILEHPWIKYSAGVDDLSNMVGGELDGHLGSGAAFARTNGISTLSADSTPNLHSVEVL